MNEIEAKVTLEQKARKSGGDRYQGELLGAPWQVYLPQTVSRPGSKQEPIEGFTIKLSYPG